MVSVISVMDQTQDGGTCRYCAHPLRWYPPVESDPGWYIGRDGEGVWDSRCFGDGAPTTTCPACDGSGNDAMMPPDDPTPDAYDGCDSCDGEGKTAEHAPDPAALARQAPGREVPDAAENASTTTSGWVESAPTGPQPAGDFGGDDGFGTAYSRRWTQPHPCGDGTVLECTITCTAMDDGKRRWLLTDIEWRWTDAEGEAEFMVRGDQSDSMADGPASEAWPTEADVIAELAGIATPEAWEYTPIAEAVDADPAAIAPHHPVEEAAPDRTTDTRPPAVAAPAPAAQAGSARSAASGGRGDVHTAAAAATLLHAHAAEFAAMTVSTEQTVANLQQVGVRGPSITLVTELHAQATTLAAAATAAADRFDGHTAAADPVRSDPALADVLRGTYLDDT